MQNQPLIMAGGAFVIGVMLAVAISGSLANGKVKSAISRSDAAREAAIAEATEALEARIATLESAVEERVAGTTATVDEKLAALEATVTGQIDALSQASEDNAEALQAALSDLATAAPAPEQTAGDAAAGMATQGPLGVGQTAIFAEGAVRAFVSAIDADAGTARLSVNGETLTVGSTQTETVSADDATCAIALAALSDEGVTIGADCGMESGAAAVTPPAPEQGYTAGQAAILADGALRVFVSGMSADGASARIAINGVEMQTVAAGSSVEVEAGDQSCSVTVTGVGNGMVGLEGSC